MFILVLLRSGLLYLFDYKKEELKNKNYISEISDDKIDEYDKLDWTSLILFIIVFLTTGFFFIYGIINLNKYGMPDKDSFYVSFYKKYKEELNNKTVNYNELYYSNNTDTFNNIKSYSIEQISTSNFTHSNDISISSSINYLHLLIKLKKIN